jgi:hypothetical protein
MRSLAIVVVEPKSDWPACVGAEDADVVAFGQESGARADVVRRACQRAATGGRDLKLAVLACNLDTHRGATRRRARVARALFAAIRPTHEGCFVLSASSNASAALRQELLRLSATLTGGLPGTTASVTVRFQSPETRSPANRVRPGLGSFPPHLPGVHPA